jgi:hypothetical protein
MNDEILLTATGQVAAGAAGGAGAIFLSPPMTRREAGCRLFVSVVGPFFATPFVVTQIGMDMDNPQPGQLRKALGINAGLGFLSWASFGVLMAWTETMSIGAKAKGPLWFASTVLQVVRGGQPVTTLTTTTISNIPPDTTKGAP